MARFIVLQPESWPSRSWARPPIAAAGDVKVRFQTNWLSLSTASVLQAFSLSLNWLIRQTGESSSLTQHVLNLVKQARSLPWKAIYFNERKCVSQLLTELGVSDSQTSDSI